MYRIYFLLTEEWYYYFRFVWKEIIPLWVWVPTGGSLRSPKPISTPSSLVFKMSDIWYPSPGLQRSNHELKCYLRPSLSFGRILLLSLMQPLWWLHSLESSPASPASQTSSLLLVRQSLLPPGTSSLSGVSPELWKTNSVCSDLEHWNFKSQTDGDHYFLIKADFCLSF